MKKFFSDISNNTFPISDKVAGKSIRKSILDLIKIDYPEFTPDKFISMSELNSYREIYIDHFLNKQISNMNELDNTVLISLKDNTTLTDKIDIEDNKQQMTFGQRVADRVALFGGSWKFIIIFGIFLLVWMSVNVVWLSKKAFDPYPFILLNLILSSLAALQAPVIMMSQNRQEEKDRERSKNDYMINLKSELEIRMLHEKIDHLILIDQQEVLEIHKVQIEMMNDILHKFEK